tara:strand:- start:1161 stop:2906 length:1746 start_codon:yes stop_codon:yes gene_type:complete
MPNIPIDAPFNNDQRSWISGFIAGLNSQRFLNNSKNNLENDKNVNIMNVMYGTQTGNAEELANEAATLADSRGYLSKISELDKIDMASLSEMENAIIVVSTYGEGDMPDNADIFWQSLYSSTAPRLDRLNYAVLALGDTSYDEFCQAGKLIDTRLEQLGAKKIFPRIDCDVDYEVPAASWLNKVIMTLPDLTSDLNIRASKSEITTPNINKQKWTKKKPYLSKIVQNRLLSGKESAKEIRHISFDLRNSDIKYEAGDSLGIIPTNCNELVSKILLFFGVDYSYTVPGKDVSIGNLLRSNFEIMTPSKDLISTIEKIAKNKMLSESISNKEMLEKFLWRKDILDLLNLTNSSKLDLDEFVSLLKPLQHRAYSISSSSKLFPLEVHLTVSAVRWDYKNRQHKGVASTFLADQMDVESQVGIFLSSNKNFRIPKDNTVPMIMVGPGTGIAPFRAFLQEREALNARGMNWLFFGDQHRGTDFLYENELNNMIKSGVLSKLDLAFSRDQSDKIYVQNRMMEEGKKLFASLEEGGHFYVCGDATRMAKDVEMTLLNIIMQHGNITNDSALEYLNKLKLEKRYLRDVY